MDPATHLAPSDRTTGDESTRRLVIVGGGFAGVWAALSAARRRRELALDDRLSIVVVSPDEFLGLRPRFYEADIPSLRVELDFVLPPVGVEHHRGRVTAVDTAGKTLVIGTERMPYDALVWAVGSESVAPEMAGEGVIHGVDTYAQAQALEDHLRGLGAAGRAPVTTAVVVGAGFTGLETATELVSRLGDAVGPDVTVRVVLVEKGPRVAPEYGPTARVEIERALRELGVEVRTSCVVTARDRDTVSLSNGETFPAETLVWTAGLRVGDLSSGVAPAADAAGRLDVDDRLAVVGVSAVWAAGDVARVCVDGSHHAVMSCQHAMPQGKVAGHNAVDALFGHPGVTYEQHLYVTTLDLGAWGAISTIGFDRDEVTAVGPAAKPMKRFVNTTLIYPPLDGNEASLFAAAALADGSEETAAARARVLRNAGAAPRAISGAPTGPEALAARRAARPA